MSCELQPEDIEILAGAITEYFEVTTGDPAQIRSAWLLQQSEPVLREDYNGLIEIVPTGISKATGIAELSVPQGIDAAHIVTFGDMPNDVPMLAWAGLGVAMGNVLLGAPFRLDSDLRSFYDGSKRRLR